MSECSNHLECHNCFSCNRIHWRWPLLSLFESWACAVFILHDFGSSFPAGFQSSLHFLHWIFLNSLSVPSDLSVASSVLSLHGTYLGVTRVVTTSCLLSAVSYKLFFHHHPSLPLHPAYLPTCIPSHLPPNYTHTHTHTHTCTHTHTRSACICSRA